MTEINITPPPTPACFALAFARSVFFFFACINREVAKSLTTKHFSVTIISVNGAEDLALLPDGLVFVSSVSIMMNRSIQHFNIPSG